jgi:hypothetical protein
MPQDPAFLVYQRSNSLQLRYSHVGETCGQPLKLRSKANKSIFGADPRKRRTSALSPFDEDHPSGLTEQGSIHTKLGDRIHLIRQFSIQRRRQGRAG